MKVSQDFNVIFRAADCLSQAHECLLDERSFWGHTQASPNRLSRGGAREYECYVV